MKIKTHNVPVNPLLSSFLISKTLVSFFYHLLLRSPINPRQKNNGSSPNTGHYGSLYPQLKTVLLQLKAPAFHKHHYRHRPISAPLSALQPSGRSPALPCGGVDFPPTIHSLLPNTVPCQPLWKLSLLPAQLRVQLQRPPSHRDGPAVPRLWLRALAYRHGQARRRGRH